MLASEDNEETALLHREQLHGGQMWSRIVRRGQVLTLVDVEGGATPAALFYNAHQLLERYNMADTLKAQHTARLCRGHVLYSDMGRVLMSIVEDSAGWHDTVTGHMTPAMSLRKFGPGPYQRLRNDFHRDTRSNFLIELGKHGLGKRDLVPNVNFFTEVRADDAGNLTFVRSSRAGHRVSLRADMDVLVVLSNTPHPLDPSETYAPRAVTLSIRRGPEVAEDDPCLTLCEENTRGFALTEEYNLSLPRA
ncbi:MAG: urea carboxylase-associated protein 2 [Myxococcaceae bacterium]|nr:urea carboxylase-associated protein 2 [Myxococcaceae bacterium]